MRQLRALLRHRVQLVRLRTLLHNRIHALLAPRPASGAEPNYKDREALGRWRGGLTSKVHLLADSGCRPLARLTSAGQGHDSLAFGPLMGRLKIARRGPGRPRTRPGRVRGDKACSSTAIRSRLDGAGSRRPFPSPRTR